MSRCMGKPTICICENKGADQLRSIIFATQIVQFLLYLYPKFQDSFFCGCTGWFVSDLVGNPEDRFSGVTAQVASDQVSRIMRKPAICIYENKSTDQLCSNSVADQYLLFHYTAQPVFLFNLKL